MAAVQNPNSGTKTSTPIKKPFSLGSLVSINSTDSRHSTVDQDNRANYAKVQRENVFMTIFEFLAPPPHVKNKDYEGEKSVSHKDKLPTREVPPVSHQFDLETSTNTHKPQPMTPSAMTPTGMSAQGGSKKSMETGQSDKGKKNFMSLTNKPDNKSINSQSDSSHSSAASTIGGPSPTSSASSSASPSTSTK